MQIGMTGGQMAPTTTRPEDGLFTNGRDVEGQGFPRTPELLSARRCCYVVRRSLRDSRNITVKGDRTAFEVQKQGLVSRW